MGAGKRNLLKKGEEVGWVSSRLAMPATTQNGTDVGVDENINKCVYISTLNNVDIFCYLKISDRNPPHLTSSVFLTTGRLIGHRAKVVVTLGVVAPP